MQREPTFGFWNFRLWLLFFLLFVFCRGCLEEFLVCLGAALFGIGCLQCLQTTYFGSSFRGWPVANVSRSLSSSCQTTGPGDRTADGECVLLLSMEKSVLAPG